MANDKCSGKSATMSAVYDRNVHTIASHTPLKIDIPLGTCAADERSELNPIDMLAMSLASCVLILMGKSAVADSADIVGAKADVSYTMADYRITSFNLDIRLPKILAAPVRARIEEACKTCPIFLAIHPDLKIDMKFNWPE